MLENHKLVDPSLVSVLILPNSSYCGISLNDIKIPEKCTLMGLLREGQIIPVKDNPTIYPEDYILAIAIHPMMVPALKVTLKKTRPCYYSLNDCLLEA
ncbi:TrkA C-terminal domain-containing protein [Iningainema tapete]|uniref:TrkA C-terminal domain-containing protein n=1 Tax=Iningainema tapete BLCC-T55 TaxID=2748662 RepID=A0A8J6XIW3_9CYAN|nr:TrkA C-terminal domain-containing protein [Iningainema tapete]MBD2777680.1 TrkA C-terminal domain-containing protein [Iningainema tapete BLCC-T55]